jgi:ribosomal protein L37AE/L43A
LIELRYVSETEDRVSNLIAQVQQAFASGWHCASCPHHRVVRESTGPWYARSGSDSYTNHCDLLENDHADPRDCPGVVDDGDEDEDDEATEETGL